MKRLQVGATLIHDPFLSLMVSLAFRRGTLRGMLIGSGVLRHSPSQKCGRLCGRARALIERILQKAEIDGWELRNLPSDCRQRLLSTASQCCNALANGAKCRQIFDWWCRINPEIRLKLDSPPVAVARLCWLPYIRSPLSYGQAHPGSLGLSATALTCEASGPQQQRQP